MLKICLGARSNKTSQEQQRALAKHSDMQKHQTTLQEHLQMFMKDVRPGVVCLWRRVPFAPLVLRDRFPPQQQISAPLRVVTRCSPCNWHRWSRGQAFMGTAGPYQGATKGSAWDLLRAWCSIVSVVGLFRAPCRQGGKPKETEPHGRNGLQPSRLHQPSTASVFLAMSEH